MILTPGLLVRHRKTGGHYQVLSEALIEATHEAVVVYRAQETGQTWVRPTAEFIDGRFETLPADAAAPLAQK